MKHHIEHICINPDEFVIFSCTRIQRSEITDDVIEQIIAKKDNRKVDYDEYRGPGLDREFGSMHTKRDMRNVFKKYKKL